jgi:hypothetical protein
VAASLAADCYNILGQRTRQLSDASFDPLVSGVLLGFFVTETSSLKMKAVTYT